MAPDGHICPECNGYVKGKRSHVGTINCAMLLDSKKLYDDGWCPLSNFYDPCLSLNHSISRVRGVLRAYGAETRVGPTRKEMDWGKKKSRWLCDIYYRKRDLISAHKWLDYCDGHKVPNKIIARAMKGDTKPLYDMVDHLKAVSSLERD